MNKSILLISLALIFFPCNSVKLQNPLTNTQQKHEVPPELAALYRNASQNGVSYRETMITQQNRYGLRIEYCVDRSDLQLWISPQAWKSNSYKDRNWSNRDNHTNVFDKIILNTNAGNFINCNYDAFNLVMNYKNQHVHVLNIFDEPAIVLWFDKDAVIDFKSKRDDIRLIHNSNEYTIESKDAGRSFHFTAVLGKGNGKFIHQQTTDENRSTYARAEIAAGQIIVIASELSSENIENIARKIAAANLQETLKSNEQKITYEFKYGNVIVKNQPELQKVLDMNKRVDISMQDGGFLRSCSQYIYYMMWYRDGGMSTPPLAYTGWSNPAREHGKIAILNPNTSYEEPKGNFYGQLMSGPITKWEEDGLFYNVWTAFTYFSQTGDDFLFKGEYGKNLSEAMDWLERRCFNSEKGLFGRYHYCESPLTNSNGDGFDQAIGMPIAKFPTKYKNDTIVRSYDIYINSITYATYLMMSAAMEGEKGNDYYNKAMKLEANIKAFFQSGNALPAYGKLQTIGNKMVIANGYGLDITDYQWALSLPLFLPNMAKEYRLARNQLLKDLIGRKNDNFIAAYSSVLFSMDTEIHNEDSILKAIDYIVPLSARNNKYLPMPYTTPEMSEIQDGDPFHDVRPIVFCSGPYAAAVSNLAVRKYPFGIAVRATQRIDKIENYQYQGGLLNFKYEGEGTIDEVVINGKSLKNCYQIPIEWLNKTENSVIVKMKRNALPAKNILIGSSVMVNSVEDGSLIKFKVKAFGKNVLQFKNLTAKIAINNDGKEADYTHYKDANITYIEFLGRGNFEVNLVK